MCIALKCVRSLFFSFFAKEKLVRQHSIPFLWWFLKKWLETGSISKHWFCIHIQFAMLLRQAAPTMPYVHVCVSHSKQWLCQRMKKTSPFTCNVVGSRNVRWACKIALCKNRTLNFLATSGGLLFQNSIVYVWFDKQTYI